MPNIFKDGGGAGIGSFVVVFKNGRLAPETDVLKLRGAYEAGEQIYISVIDEETKDALVPASGWIDEELKLHLAARDFDDGKTYILTISDAPIASEIEIEYEIEDAIDLGGEEIPTKEDIQEELSSKADLVDGKVPASQLPSYVDDVVEYEDLAHFPEEGAADKIYLALNTGYTYRWSGTEYVQIGGQDLSEYYTKTEVNDLLDGQLATKQDTLVSGENIKTVNGNSLLGSGDIEIQGGMDQPAIIGLLNDIYVNGTGGYVDEDGKPSLIIPGQEGVRDTLAAMDLDVCRYLIGHGGYFRDSFNRIYYAEPSSENSMDVVVIHNTTWSDDIGQSSDERLPYLYTGLSIEHDPETGDAYIAMGEISSNPESLIPFAEKLLATGRVTSQEQVVGMMNDILVKGSTEYTDPDGKACFIVPGYASIRETIENLNPEFLRQFLSLEPLDIPNSFYDTRGRRYYDFEALSEDGSDLFVTNPAWGEGYPEDEAYPLISTTFTIDTDPETGDSSVEAGEMVAEGDYTPFAGKLLETGEFAASPLDLVTIPSIPAGTSIEDILKDYFDTELFRQICEHTYGDRDSFKCHDGLGNAYVFKSYECYTYDPDQGFKAHVFVESNAKAIDNEDWSLIDHAPVSLYDVVARRDVETGDEWLEATLIKNTRYATIDEAAPMYKDLLKLYDLPLSGEDNDIEEWLKRFDSEYIKGVAAHIKQNGPWSCHDTDGTFVVVDLNPERDYNPGVNQLGLLFYFYTNLPAETWDGELSFHIHPPVDVWSYSLDGIDEETGDSISTVSHVSNSRYATVDEIHQDVFPDWTNNATPVNAKQDYLLAMDSEVVRKAIRSSDPDSARPSSFTDKLGNQYTFVATSENSADVYITWNLALKWKDAESPEEAFDLGQSPVELWTTSITQDSETGDDTLYWTFAEDSRYATIGDVDYKLSNYTTATDVQSMIDAAIGAALAASY